MTGPEVTAAMKAEGVDPALVEIIAKRRYEVARLTDKYPENWPTWERLAQEEAVLTVAFREMFLNGARGDLAAVLPEIQAQAWGEAARVVHAEARYQTELAGRRSLGAEYTAQRLLVIEKVLLDRAARLTTTTEEPTHDH